MRSRVQTLRVKTETARRAGWPYLLVVPALLLVGIVFIYPAGTLLTRSFTAKPAGLSHYREFIDSPLLTILTRSAWTALIVTLISLVVAYPLAYLAATSSTRLRTAILGTVGVSLFISVVVRGYSWLTILDRNGLMNTTLRWIGLPGLQHTLVHNFAGVVIGMIQYGIPFMVFPLYDVMRRIDRRLTYAAETLGARPWVAFTRVFLPLTIPGVMAGSTIVFVATIGYYVLPSILGGPSNTMIGEFIATQFQTTLDWGLGSAAASILFAIALLAFFVFYRLSARAYGGRVHG
jgi:putative spermidine/putrescine transport system permease protein